MEKVFDLHVHYSFEIPLKETVEIFEKEFAETGAYKYNFLSMPHHVYDGETLTLSELQNEKGLFLKQAFSPNAYAFAGLKHPANLIYNADVANDFLEQVKHYNALGFDGIKMLEGYPQFRKATGVKLCDTVYDKFYTYLEEKGIPIIMHVANPAENWDASKISEYAKANGRGCDETYPTKTQLDGEVISVMQKHPNLKLGLAHFGFLTYDIKKAKEFLDNYLNTFFDITPGGEQFFNMLNDWKNWSKFFYDYQDRIFYGTDFYAFPVTTEKEWRANFTRRPNFLRQFFETDGEHEYVGEKFHGVKLEKRLRDKIYRENAEKLLGNPKKINQPLFKKMLEKQLGNCNLSALDKADLEYMLKKN